MTSHRHSVDLDIHLGLMIDVIPLDAVPKSKWKQLWQMVDSMMYCCFNFQRLPAHKGKVTYYAEKLALTLVPSFKARYKLWRLMKVVLLSLISVAEWRMLN